MLPLQGLRVLDFGRVLSAPYGTQVFADLGADVVKVEHPEKGDDTRSFGPPFVGAFSTYFLAINRGKRSIALNLKKQGDLTLAKKLAAVSDVVVENFRPDVMTRLGLGAEQLLQENPRLIYASLSGFGRNNITQPGYDLMIQGLSGIPSITGAPDGEPYKCGASIADLVAGMNLVQGVLAALYRREKTGKGGIVDVSMIDGQLSLLTYHASAFLNAGVEPRRMGNEHPSIHPFRPYQTADGYVNICVGNDRLFVQLCKAFGHPEWAQDARFETNPKRVAHRQELDALLIPLFKSQSQKHVLVQLRKFKVPAEGMASIPEALQQAKTVTHESEHGPIQTLAMGFRIDNGPLGNPMMPPKLGEHTEEVIRQWLQ